mmetsp:Transcript_24277/g.43496  ORF Transcript_24277/g.43496 Transcript_24277/m.43496 type:complete len:274 (-) Transcript_24277:294-1115(-)
MSIETISVNLEDCGSLTAPDVVDHCLSSLRYIGGILSINMKTWDTIVLSLFVNFAILGDILRERVDSTSIVNDKDEKGEIVLRSRVEKFCHTSILGTAFTDENNGDSVIIRGWGDILLLENIIIRNRQFAVQQNTFCRTSSVGKLFGNKCPSSLEIRGLVENMHGSTGTLAASSFLHEEFGHNLAGRDTTGNGMGVLTVIGVLLIPILDGIVHERWDGFLSIVKMHESPNFSLHVLLVAGVLKSSCQLKRFVDLHECIFAVLHFSSVHVNLCL